MAKADSITLQSINDVGTIGTYRVHEIKALAKGVKSIIDPGTRDEMDITEAIYILDAIRDKCDELAGYLDGVITSARIAGLFEEAQAPKSAS